MAKLTRVYYPLLKALIVNINIYLLHMDQEVKKAPQPMVSYRSAHKLSSSSQG